MFKKLTLFTILAAASYTLSAQVTSTPPLLQEDTENVVVYFHADQGNQGLLNQPSTAALYAHTGVITDKSTSLDDWVNAPTWGDNSAKYKLEYVSPNLWKLNIGDIRAYYDITDPSVEIKKLAFVFRNADKTLEGKGPNNSNMYIDVLPDGLQVLMQSSLTKNIVDASTGEVSFTLYCTDKADLSISVNGTEIGSASGASEMTAAYTFPSPGNYDVTGTAVYDGQTVSTTSHYAYSNPSGEKPYPGGVPRMGAVRSDGDDVTFCIAAPGKGSAIIVGDWNGYEVSDDYTMSYQDYQGDRYFWITVPGLERGKDHIYYYVIDGQISVGDPYARLVLDPYNDKYISAEVYPDLPEYPYDKVSDVPLAVFNDNLNEYDWQVTDFKGADKNHLVIYELLLRDFTGTEGKALGDGTVRLAMEKIPYLKKLGVNAIELLPINEFNGNISWGYNPNFYFAPDKAYGTPDDYKAFIDECHKNGIAVILDMVFNQTDWLHPWYQMYPVGSNPFYNATAPHAFSVLNDWNQGYPLVRQQFCDVVKYWLEEYKVDGYRFDLVKGLGDNSSYANSGAAATGAFNQSRIDNMRELQLAMQEVTPDAYFINENLAGAQEENAMAEYGQLNWANLNNQGQQFAMGYAADSGLDRMYAPNDSRLWGSTVSYLESHDEQRLAYAQNTSGVTGVRGNIVNSMRRLGSAAAQMLMAPGAHMIWQFSELGNPQSTKSSNGDNNTDPKTVNWKYYDNANRRGLYDCYAELNGLRTANADFFDEDTQVSINTSASAWNNGRTIALTRGDRQILLAVNPNTSGDPLNVFVPFKSTNSADYKVLSKSYDTNPVFSAENSCVTVEPNCYAVIGSASLTGVDEVIGSGSAETESIRFAAAAGRLVIDAAPATVSVYTASGRLAARLDAGQSISLPSGIYILRAASASAKLLIP